MTLVRKVKYTCALCSYCVHTGGPEPLTGGAAPASDGARRPVPVISEDRSSVTYASGSGTDVQTRRSDAVTRRWNGAERV